MKIALFSDVHANLPAFEVFLQNLDSRQPDTVYCLGDLVGYNVWPDEVINEVRHRKVPAIAGNHDVKVIGLKPPASLAETGKAYAYHIISEGGRTYLKTLPAHLKIEFQLNTEKLNLLLVHGSPRSNSEYMLEDMNEVELLQILKETNADILCCGHSHKPYHRIVNSGTNDQPHFHHIINIGSVGKPKDGDPRGCYVILTLDEQSSVLNKDSVKAEFIRLEYDVEKAVAAVKSSPLPDEFADALLNAN